MAAKNKTIISTNGTEMVGLAQLRRVMDELPPKVERRVMPFALGKGSAILVKAIKANVKAMVGRGSRQFSKDKETKKRALWKSIGKRVWKNAAKGRVAVVVGPRWPEGAHGHLVEFGHEIVIPLRDGTKKRTGRRTRPIPFQRRAVESSKQAIARTIADAAEQRLAKEAAKL